MRRFIIMSDSQQRAWGGDDLKPQPNMKTILSRLKSFFSFYKEIEYTQYIHIYIVECNF